MLTKPAPLTTFLETLVDSRRAASCRHNFIDILVIAICSIIANADTWEDMEEFGHEKEDWLRTFLELPSGIPSHDTFYRTFCLLDPNKFQDCFTRWVKSAFPEALDIPDDTHIVPIDGKAIKGSRDKGKGKRAVHIVSAWSSKLSLILGQKKVDKKSNEITAVPDLLAAIDLRGCMITADAMSCQKSIAETCISEGADYLLAVKGNQVCLYGTFSGRTLSGRTLSGRMKEKPTPTHELLHLSLSPPFSSVIYDTTVTFTDKI